MSDSTAKPQVLEFPAGDDEPLLAAQRTRIPEQPLLIREFRHDVSALPVMGDARPGRWRERLAWWWAWWAMVSTMRLLWHRLMSEWLSVAGRILRSKPQM